MKVFLAILCTLIAAAVARPEPPVNQYHASYSTTQQDSFAPPGLSDTYGAPALLSSYSAPSSTYGAPAASYHTPASTYSAPAARTTFNLRPSSRISYSKSSKLSSPARLYGAPAFAQTSALFSAPSSTYGAPSALSSHYSAPSSTYGVPGYARQAADDMSVPANYEFGYSVNDAYSGSDFSHQESRQEDVAWGSYTVLLPDGRKQIVDYEADQAGFRPKIRYEETGAGGYARSGPY